MTNKTDSAVGEGLSVRRREFPRLQQLGIKILAHGGVRSIGTHKDVAFSLSSVTKTKEDTITALSHGEHLLSKVEAFFGDLAPEEVIQLWAGDHIALSTEPISEKKGGFV